MICYRNMRFSFYRMPRYASLHIGAFLFLRFPKNAVNLQCRKGNNPIRKELLICCNNQLTKLLTF